MTHRTRIRVLMAAACVLVAVPLTTARYPVADEPAVSTGPYDPIRTEFSDYLWPTEARRKITSTFAEYRSTHFHGGIDIGTGSTTGFRVFASRDGYVATIHVQPDGYGKMLYVRHPDGYYTTYAHLDHFDERIEERVKLEQQRLGKYPVIIRCNAEEFPVKKGEVIAYTGETGSGSPHLHFEIRDPFLDFVNPFLSENLHAEDNISPTVYKIAVKPLGEGSRVDGSTDPQVYYLRSAGHGRYIVNRTIHITGNAGFAVAARDRSNASWFRLGVYSHQLYIDDALVYYVQLDRAPSEEAQQIGLYYDMEMKDRGFGRFEKLYMDSPNSLRFYQPRGDSAGILRSPDHAEGTHTFRIIVSDFSNNRTEVSGLVVFNHPPQFTVESSPEALRLHFTDISSVDQVLLSSRRVSGKSWVRRKLTPQRADSAGTMTIGLTPGKDDIVKVAVANRWGSWSPPQIFFPRKPDAPGGTITLHYDIEDALVRVRLETNRIFTSVPILAVYEGDARRAIPVTAIDANSYRATFVPLDTWKGTRQLYASAEVDGDRVQGNAEFELYPLVAGTSDTIRYDDGNLTIASLPTSLYKTVFLQIHKRMDDGELRYTLEPHRTVLRGPLAVSVNDDGVRAGRGLYFGAGRGDLKAVPQSIAGKNVFTCRITQRLGDLSIQHDITPPVISGLRISRAASRLPSITFRFSDDCSGVEYDGLMMYIDGVMAIPQIDGEHRRASYTASTPLERGTHRLTIHLRDKMGNVRELEHQFIAG